MRLSQRGRMFLAQSSSAARIINLVFQQEPRPSVHVNTEIADLTFQSDLDFKILSFVKRQNYMENAGTIASECLEHCIGPGC